MVKKPKLNFKIHHKTTKPDRTRYTMPFFLRVLLSVLLIAGFSFLFAWFIQLRYMGDDLDQTWEFITESGTLFWYSYAVMFFLTSAVVALLWRTFFGLGIVFSAISIIAYINEQKYIYRNAPLLPEDFQMIGNAGEIMTFVDPWEIVRLVLGVVFILLGSGILEFCVRRWLGRNLHDKPWWERWSLVPRFTFFLLSCVGLVLLAEPIIEHSRRSNEPIPWLNNTVLVGWNQTLNYERNGFVIGFIYNLSRATAEQPENYSRETMAEVLQKYQAIQAADKQRLPLDELVDNIIIILDETFYDPELLTKYYAHTGGDIIPNLHKIFKLYPSGYMYSPEYGGGTANVEFEVLTGLSNYWLGTIPYIEAVPKLSSLPATPSWTKRFNFDTVAIHAYDGNMYKRNIVYPKIGYNDFIDLEDMNYTDRENQLGYVSDSQVYQEILDLIDQNSGKQMVGAVTMQNHAAYNSAQYPHLNFLITTGLGSYDLEANFQSIHYADQYLGEFIAALDKLDEKTVLLWFGDHGAGILNQYINSPEESDRYLAHLTPYFIYTNFEVENLYTTAEIKQQILQVLHMSLPTASIDLPTTTPNCLMNTLYNLLDAEKPTLMYILDEVCTTTPILTGAYYGDGNAPISQALLDYQLVNYDLLTGKQYWSSF